jgi:hypothetical protein
MGAVKEAMMECHEAGLVWVNEDFGIPFMENQAARDLLAGMPLRHTITNRWGEPCELPVIPVAVAVRLERLFPEELNDTIGWQLDMIAETLT